MKSNQKTLFITILTAFFLFAIPLNSLAESEPLSIISEIPKNINININHETTKFKVAIINNDAYIPIRAFAYALNSDIRWSKEDKSTRIEKSTKDLNLKNIQYSMPKERFPIGVLSDNSPIYLNHFQSELLTANVANIQNTNYIPIDIIQKTTNLIFKLNPKHNTIHIINPEIINPNTINFPKFNKKELLKLGNIDPLVGIWLGYDSFTDYEDGVVHKTNGIIEISKNKNNQYNLAQRIEINDDYNIQNNEIIIYTVYNNLIFNKSTKSIYLDPNKIDFIISSEYDEIDPGEPELFLQDNALSCSYLDGGFAYYEKASFIYE